MKKREIKKIIKILLKKEYEFEIHNINDDGEEEYYLTMIFRNYILDTRKISYKDFINELKNY